MGAQGVDARYRMSPALRPRDTCVYLPLSGCWCMFPSAAFDRLLAYWHASSCVVAQVETQPGM
jgi:transposase